MEYVMKKKYSQKEIRQGFENLARLKQENTRLKIILSGLEDELAVYKAREVASYMESLGFNNNEASAVLNMLKRHVNKFKK